MQRAVIYARYSPGPNQTEQSIEGQVRECTKYAELHDLRIVGTYIDRKISGKTDNRREFQRMIDDSEKHIFDVIILYHTDRFARNRYDSAIYKHKLKENGVELRYATTDIPKGPEGIILESIMEGWAEYYSAELSRKIKRGMRESALKCHSTGAGRCLGYRTAEDKSLVIEPEGAKAVQTVFDMYIKGKSHADICRYLNDCGFRTAQGKLFNKNSVTHIIRNKRYIGVYTYDDIMIEDGIPAIISKDTFHLAQLEAARRKTAKRPKEPKAEYLLSGKAFCGHCQKPLVGVSGTGKSGNKWYYYYCQESRAKRGCTKKPVKRDWLEREVVERTVAEVLQPEVIQHIAKKCYDLQMEYRQNNSDVLFYELKLKDVRKAIKNTMHAIESGVKTKTLPARLQELENEEEALEAELAIAKASDFVITTDQIEFLLTQFAEPWECESEEEYHRRIIKCFVHKVFLFDDKLLIYYNVSRDGKTREQSEAELLEEALGEGFDKRSSGSTKTKSHSVRNGFFVLAGYGWHEKRCGSTASILPSPDGGCASRSQAMPCCGTANAPQHAANSVGGVFPAALQNMKKRHFCQSPNQRLNCCDCVAFSMDILIFESNLRTIPSEEVAAACRMLGNCTPSPASVAALFCGGAVKLYEVFESLSGASLSGCSARFFKICAACTYRRDQAS